MVRRRCGWNIRLKRLEPVRTPLPIQTGRGAGRAWADIGSSSAKLVKAHFRITRWHGLVRMQGICAGLARPSNSRNMGIFPAG